MGWGHYGRNCPNEYPVEGSVNWENLKGEVAKEGGTLPQQGNPTQVQTQPQSSESTPSHYARAVTSTISKRLNGGGLKGGGYVPAPEYHNPDPLVQFIGPANEGKVEIEVVKTTALIDTGACMSAMTKSFAEALELELKSLELNIRYRGNMGGGKVPYHGYVECRLNLPQIEKFDQDVLMLVIADSPYGARVPIQIGTLHIDMAISLAT